ncbi:hypothetical protein EST38_g9911 [Candolleomyces aberdarensis]|uniref:Uncharacterized protein n=1 Tax=Candolleomyces aberdarensis TaxID=2316362 RepID=A0A4Q2DB54_9AGAR|nr:hypothetical protein EST38_g9911 [Candolleomyces aberdarensis]
MTCLPSFDIESLPPELDILDSDELSELPPTYAAEAETHDSLPSPSDSRRSALTSGNSTKKRTLEDAGFMFGRLPPSRDHIRRRLDRELKVIKNGHQPRRSVVGEVVRSACERSVNLDAETLPASSCGYQARIPSEIDVPGDGKLADYLAAGYRHEKWDGITPTPYQDAQNRVFMVLAGKLDDRDSRPPGLPSFDESCAEVATAILDAGEKAQFSPEELSHRRGNHGLGLHGIFHGNGTKKPCNLKMGRHAELLKELCGDWHVKRMASFASSCFKLWAPRVFQEYHDKLSELQEHDVTLKMPFVKSVYPCVGFNFGPRVCTVPHRDHYNVPYGWCSIQSFGEFDHREGGHLVIHDLKLVIDFPAGSVILIPSATLTHSNTPVQEGETRVSMTQFCSGGLFRYVDNRFQTQDGLRETDKEAWKEIMTKKATRWREGLELLSTMEELQTEANVVISG